MVRLVKEKAGKQESIHYKNAALQKINLWLLKGANLFWAADVVYLCMKPLEWIFLLVLYLFDEKPEDRICSQYLPKEPFLV